MDLTEKIVTLHTALARAGLPHAFGGALALAWCTQRARGTIDIDINVFLPVADRQRLLEALPEGVKVSRANRNTLEREGQVRLWWDQTPLDVFLNTTDYHDSVAARIQYETFAHARIPFLACLDVAVFKAFFNRTRDWADLEEMQLAGTLDTTEVKQIIARYLGSNDERIESLTRLADRITPLSG